MNHTYEFEYEGIILRPLSEKDLENLRILRNTYREFFLSSSEISKEQQLQWFQRYLSKESDIMFSIERKGQNGFIGAIAIYDIDQRAKTAEIGRIMIDKNIVPQKGYGTLAVKAIVHFAFEQLRLVKLTSVILKENLASIRVHEKAGFSLSFENGGTYVLQKICP